MDYGAAVQAEWSHGFRRNADQSQFVLFNPGERAHLSSAALNDDLTTFPFDRSIYVDLSHDNEMVVSTSLLCSNSTLTRRRPSFQLSVYSRLPQLSLEARTVSSFLKSFLLLVASLSNATRVLQLNRTFDYSSTTVLCATCVPIKPAPMASSLYTTSTQLSTSAPPKAKRYGLDASIN
jgi:hypothetical protein